MNKKILDDRVNGNPDLFDIKTMTQKLLNKLQKGRKKYKFISEIKLDDLYKNM